MLIARIDRPHFGAIGALVDLDLDERQQLLRFFNRTRACDLDDVDGRVATAAPLDLDVPGDVRDFELAIVAELYGLGELFGLLFAAVAVVDADARPRPLALLIDGILVTVRTRTSSCPCAEAAAGRPTAIAPRRIETVILIILSL